MLPTVSYSKRQTNTTASTSEYDNTISYFHTIFNLRADANLDHKNGPCWSSTRTPKSMGDYSFLSQPQWKKINVSGVSWKLSPLRQPQKYIDTNHCLDLQHTMSKSLLVPLLLLLYVLLLQVPVWSRHWPWLSNPLTSDILMKLMQLAILFAVCLWYPYIRINLVSLLTSLFLAPIDKDILHSLFY